MDITKVQEKQIIIRKPSTLAGLIKRFLKDQDVASSSKSTYSRSLRQFISWLEETGRASRMDQLDREDILAYKEYLTEGKSSYTVSLYMTSVRKLFQWLESKKIYPNIARDVKGSRKPKGHRKEALTADQIRDILEGLETDSLEAMRDFALINLMARTGLRDVEVSRALVGDIRQESGQPVLWIQGKGRDTKDDFVVLMDKALEPIKRYISARGKLSPDEPLFCSHSNRNYGQSLTTRSVSRIVKEALRRVGLDDIKLSAHSLRHTAITLSIVGGASLQQAQAMARHSDPRTTLVYFHNLNRVQAGAERYIDF